MHHGHGGAVTLVGRPTLQAAVREAGLTLCGLGFESGAVHLPPDAAPTIVTDLHQCDWEGVGFALVAVKSGSTEQVAKELAAAELPESVVVVSMQNGVDNARVLQQHLPSHTVVACVVGFNVVWRQPNATFHRGTNTPLVVGALHISSDGAARRVARLLNEAARLETHVSAHIAHVQWTKLMMNLNNALDALSRLPIRRQLGREAHRWTLAACQAEALRVFDAHPDIRLERMGLFIPRITPHLLRLPNWLYLRITPLRVTDEARGSMWQDLAAGRPTEVDHLNGVIQRLGREKNIPTPVHDAVVATIREAEKRKQSPRLEPEQLYERIVGSPFSHRHRQSHALLALLLLLVAAVAVVVALRYVALP